MWLFDKNANFVNDLYKKTYKKCNVLIIQDIPELIHMVKKYSTAYFVITMTIVPLFRLHKYILLLGRTGYITILEQK